MRRVKRVHTGWKWPDLASTDFPWVEKGLDTLTKRRVWNSGDSLYPWAKTKLEISGGKRKWVAKTQEDWYALLKELGVEDSLAPEKFREIGGRENG